jgi:hypothetical protein
VVGESFVQLVVADEKAHINRAVEGIEEEIEIRVKREFAAIDAAPQSLIGLPTPGPEEAVAKGLE